MKMEKHWKRFFTLDRHHAEGFTLVELIVVIAILAILGGVAVPAYSGYVAKAELAGDQQLLATVNTAFASACLENGVDVYLVNSAEIDWGTDGKKTVKGAYVNEINDAFDQAFDAFYAGNESSEFKTEYSIVFDGMRHAFILLVEGETVALSYGGGYIYVSAEDVQKLADSTFGEIGMDSLMGKVDQATAYALAASPDSTLGKLISGQSALIAQKLGADEYKNTLIERATMLASKDGVTFDNESDLIASDYWTSAISDVNANHALLDAAANSSTAITTDFIDQLKAGNAKDAIKENADDAGVTMAQAAFAYGMYTSYCASAGITVPETLDHSAVLKEMSTDGFKAYMAGEQAQTDMDGYLAAMDMINSSTDDNEAVSNILVNGFTDPELLELLNSLSK